MNKKTEVERQRDEMKVTKNKRKSNGDIRLGESRIEKVREKEKEKRKEIENKFRENKRRGNIEKYNFHITKSFFDIQIKRVTEKKVYMCNV
jgi:hypothetical protein